MTRTKPRSVNFLALLLGGALALSLGVNGLLLAERMDEWTDDVSDELAATTADLHLTQRLLANCQQQHQQRQDSLLSPVSDLAGGPPQPER